MTDATNAPQPLRAWMEPEVRTLDVHETAATSGPGGDGSPVVDCSRS